MNNTQDRPSVTRGPTALDRAEAARMEADVRAGRRKDPRQQLKEDFEAMHQRWERNFARDRRDDPV